MSVTKRSGVPYSLRIVGPDERAEVSVENVNGYYDKGFATTVLDSGVVKVESEHYTQLVTDDLFPLPGRRSIKGMQKAVERAKKRLQKREDRLISFKEEFNG